MSAHKPGMGGPELAPEGLSFRASLAILIPLKHRDVLIVNEHFLNKTRLFNTVLY